MMTYGMQITAPNDELKKVSVEQVLMKIKNPTAKFEEQITQLRILKNLDEKAYKKRKTQLPYFVCSTFHPLIRKTAHFAAAYHMVVDIDHCGREQIAVEVLKSELAADPEVRGVFISPGGDGLKVIFDFDERITDPGIYAILYKNYLLQFANKYAIENVVDFVTHDVTRACFFSVDRAAWINPNPIPLKVSNWLDQPNSGELALVEKAFKQEVEKRAIKDSKPEVDSVLEDETLNLIKSKLFPRRILAKEKEVYIPEALQTIGTSLADHLSTFNMVLKSEEPIHYGQKLRIEAGRHFAEINLFYGKRGFSVVKTMKSGSNKDLSDLAYEAIQIFLAEKDFD